jgi:ligand-binding sensor domain-containing protein
MELVRYLNGNIWRPAKENGKPVAASVNVVFSFVAGRIYGRMQRMDLSELAPPGDPVIYNKGTVYTNPSLKSYDFKTWTKYNSPLPDNISKSSIVDKTDILWYTTAKGLTRFDGQTFNPVNEFNSPFNSETAIGDINVDKDNNKWVYVDDKMYKYSDAGWQIFDFKKFVPPGGPVRILNNLHGDLLFTTTNGLVVLRKDKVVVLNKKTIPLLPSNNVSYAYEDSRKRLWIGTPKGSIMIDHNVPTTYNKSNTPLKDTYISNATEDEAGNLYFSLVANNATPGDNDKEGIAVLKTNGTWMFYNDKNSGMPSNHVNDILYDKFEHVLWIGTEQSGIVRFNLKDGWENYHNNNSPAPGHAIYQLVQDSKGVIYAATANGLLRIKRK